MTPIRRPIPEPRPDALLRYVSGASPLAEAESIRIWAAGNAERTASIEELRAAWNQKAAAPEWDKGGVWDRLAQHIPGAKVSALQATDPATDPATGPATGPATDPATVLRRPPLTRYVQRSRWSASHWLIAAAALVLAGSGVYATTHKSPESVIPANAPAREVVTTRGQQATLDLADGTRVTLGADSRLRIPSSYDKSGTDGVRRRDVELTGRAFFDVVHDTTRPFVVHTSTAVTKDVGTSFVISAYPEAHMTEVVVVSGSVGLWDRPRSSAPDNGRRARPLMMLTRGDLATLDTNGTATRARNVSLTTYTSWLHGDLVFDRMPVRIAIRELERWYDIDVHVTDRALLDQRITATIHGETADAAVQHLALTLGANVRQNGRVVTFVPRDSDTRSETHGNTHGEARGNAH
jgi:transmembrane sensor